MQSLSFEAIQPLIYNVQEQGRSIQVIFRCPVSGKEVQARHYQAKDNSMGARIQESAQRSALYAVQQAIGETIRSVFGYNIFGRVAGDVARQTVYSASSQMNNSLSPKEKQEAIRKAFQSVQRQFTWDEKNSRWISSQAVQEALSEFDLQNQKYPITHNYDKKILTRMLVELAMADGSVSTSEAEWLNSMIDPSIGSIDSISQLPKLTQQELQQASAGSVRETMLMLTWALALCDEELATQEKELLLYFGQGLALSPTQIGQIQGKAQNYILEKSMDWLYSASGGEQFARQSILTLASKIGMSPQQALQVEAQFQRRRS